MRRRRVSNEHSCLEETREYLFLCEVEAHQQDVEDELLVLPLQEVHENIRLKYSLEVKQEYTIILEMNVKARRTI